jgi:hypothetical protein
MFVGEVAAHVMPLVPLATLRQAGLCAVFCGSSASRLAPPDHFQMELSEIESTACR